MYELPAINPDIVLVTPVPTVVIAPGILFKVQVPVAGKPLNTTLAVAKVHVGCVIAPTIGAVGVAGCALTTAFADDNEVQPVIKLVTLNV